MFPRPTNPKALDLESGAMVSRMGWGKWGEEFEKQLRRVRLGILDDVALL